MGRRAGRSARWGEPCGQPAASLLARPLDHALQPGALTRATSRARVSRDSASLSGTISPWSYLPVTGSNSKVPGRHFISGPRAVSNSTP